MILYSIIANLSTSLIQGLQKKKKKVYKIVNVYIETKKMRYVIIAYESNYGIFIASYVQKLVYFSSHNFIIRL